MTFTANDSAALIASVRAMSAKQLAAAATKSMKDLEAAERTGERDQIARALIADERLCGAIDFVTRERTPRAPWTH